MALFENGKVSSPWPPFSQNVRKMPENWHFFRHTFEHTMQRQEWQSNLKSSEVRDKPQQEQSCYYCSCVFSTLKANMVREVKHYQLNVYLVKWLMRKKSINWLFRHRDIFTYPFYRKTRNSLKCKRDTDVSWFSVNLKFTVFTYINFIRRNWWEQTWDKNPLLWKSWLENAGCISHYHSSRYIVLMTFLNVITR